MAPYKNPTPLFQDLTCRADLVVIGNPQKQMSHLSASRAAIYTDYDFEIDTLFRASLQSIPQQHIVITRPGGAPPVQGDSVAYSNGMLPLAKLRCSFWPRTPRTTSRTARGAAIRDAGPFAVKAARVGSRVTRRFSDCMSMRIAFWLCAQRPARRRRQNLDNNLAASFVSVAWYTSPILPSPGWP